MSANGFCYFLLTPLFLMPHVSENEKHSCAQSCKRWTMNQGFASLIRPQSTMSTITFSHIHPRSLTLLKSSNVLHVLSFPQIRIKQPTVGCSQSTPWESSPVTYAPTETAGDNFLKKTTNLLESLKSNNTAEVPVTNTEDVTDSSNQPVVQLQFHK